MSSFYVYILTNKNNTTLYVGMTNELERRIREHKSGIPGSFSQRYNLNKLIYFEEHSTAEEAFIKEKQMKRWRRSWKEDLINSMNPNWEDLSLGWE